MATSDLRRFYFYQEYVWAPADFANLQTWIYGSMQSIFEGAFGAAVLKGLDPTVAGGMILNIAAGVACGDSGEVIVSNSALNPTIPLPGASAQNSIVVLRPTSVDSGNIPLPTDQSQNVPLYSIRGFTMLVLSKIPAFKNDYPTKQTGDVIVAGVQLQAGVTSIVQSNLDLGIIDRPAKKPLRVKTVTNGITLNPSKDHIHEIDFSAASGVIQMPSASLFPGHEVEVIRIDSSSNEAGVSGFNAELISGQNYLTVTQWDHLKMYSNGAAWRII